MLTFVQNDTQNAVNDAFKVFAEDIIQRLASQYDFDFKQACRFILHHDYDIKPITNITDSDLKSTQEFISSSSTDSDSDVSISTQEVTSSNSDSDSDFTSPSISKSHSKPISNSDSLSISEPDSPSISEPISKSDSPSISEPISKPDSLSTEPISKPDSLSTGPISKPDSPSISEPDSPSISEPFHSVLKPYPKTTFPLPFTGVIYKSCFGIKNKHELFIQCPGKPFKNNFCKTCAKQASTNPHGKPNSGTIQDRMAVPCHLFRDPRNKRPKPFGAVIQKLKINKDDVIKEFQEHGIVVPDIQWNTSWPTQKKHKKQKISPIVDESEPDSEHEPVNYIPLPKHHPDHDHDHDIDISEYDDSVVTITFNGTSYFKGKSDDIYDIDTEKKIGYFADENVVLFADC
jgi:hypothetical protein